MSEPETPYDADCSMYRDHWQARTGAGRHTAWDLYRDAMAKRDGYLRGVADTEAKMGPDLAKLAELGMKTNQQQAENYQKYVDERAKGERLAAAAQCFIGSLTTIKVDWPHSAWPSYQKIDEDELFVFKKALADWEASHE